jgi:tRNA pseudouridine32 synthase/23S rRNA pseudouridine746 synthase
MELSRINVVDDQPGFIIVSKPAGMNFHDEGEINSGFFNEVKSSLQLPELYPVHRLDKMTSGLLIFAKNIESARIFQVLFEQHKIQKFYLAISDKKPKKKQGLIKGDMSKSRRSAWKLLRTMSNPAVTQFMSYGLGNGFRLFLVKPHSGKTHQIRVALNSVGSPIIGDDIYHPTSKQDRGYLHAYALSFCLNDKVYNYVVPPNTGEHFTQSTTIEILEKIACPHSIQWPKV